MREPPQVLLVEDNPGDVRLMKEALRETNFACKLTISSDGIDALELLRRHQGDSGIYRPDLIILDIQLPGRSGLEVLGDIKHDTNLRSIPVVILTSSGDDEDIARAYDLQANCYITKPSNPRQLGAVLKLIEQFWLGVVRLPGNR